MQLIDWQDKNKKAMQIQLAQNWLICINGKHATEVFRLPENQNWQCHYAPSQEFTLQNNMLNVAHLGVWVFGTEKPAN